jgi:tetratricopeptide (TPR) repeat protein
MFRIASWYATVAYVLVLVANAVFPDIGLTRGEVRYLIAGLALGFPVALVIGWIFVPPSTEHPEKVSEWQRLRWRLGPALSIVVVVFVTTSGTFLWGFNARHAGEADAAASAAQVVAVLPFDHSGAVDDAFMAGLRDSVDTELSLAGVRLIASPASSALGDAKSSIADIAKATGATLVIRGSVQRADAKSDYQAYFELISAADGVTLDSRKTSWSSAADPGEVQKSVASTIAARAHLLSILEHYFAPGYPSTKDTGALQFFRRGLLNYMNADYDQGIQMLRAAVKLDPGFAQAHAYIAYFEAANPDPDLADPKTLVAQEIAAAESKVPGLPETGMARASRALYLDNDPTAAANALKPVAEALGNTYNVHMMQGFLLRETGHWQEALHEFQAAAAIDPYSRQVANHIAQLGLALRHYDDMRKYLGLELQRWPLSGPFYLGRAQVQFSEDGDLDKFAQVIGGDFAKFSISPSWSRLVLYRLEVAHFQGKHADVIRGLKSIRLPQSCPQSYDFPEMSVPDLCVDPFTAESLRLSGKDQEASAFAKLRAPEWNRRTHEDSGAQLDLLNLALLQAFGGDQAALETLRPVLASLASPVTQWTRDQGNYSVGAAAVLAWCGRKQEAVAMLSKSLEATYGAHAALVARDPVWRPLYQEPAFAALLASHGQTLTRVP